MECRSYICVVVLLTLIELSLSLATSDQVSTDDDVFGYADKRKSLFRFGKRAPFRFGKRGSILRFGKRPSSMYDFNEYDLSDFVPSEFSSFGGDDLDFADKRSSLFRFGKRDPEKEKKPHTPWRFGREELFGDVDFGSKQ
ncbi:hypothetical protein ACF0H5_011442 [Mactra antiquata]